MPKYVIRANEFKYNDSGKFFEAYDIIDRKIYQIFNSKVLAQKNYQELIIKTIREKLLLNTSTFNPSSLMNSSIYQKIDEFTLKHFGEIYDEWLGDIPFERMTDEQAFEFAQIAELLRFDIIEYSDDIHFYVIKLLDIDEYLYYLPRREAMLCKSTNSNFSNNDYTHERVVIYSLIKHFNTQFPKIQDRSDLFTDLNLLENFLIENPEFIYAKEKINFSIIYEATLEQIKIFNGLLKNPIFEMVTLPIDTLPMLDKLYFLEYL